MISDAELADLRRRAAWGRGKNWQRQQHAVTAVWKAVKRGELVRPDACSRCGAKGKVQGHHEDYAMALDVIWLCHSCHRRRHVEMKREDALLAQQSAGG